MASLTSGQISDLDDSGTADLSILRRRMAYNTSHVLCREYHFIKPDYVPSTIGATQKSAEWKKLWDVQARMRKWLDVLQTVGVAKDVKEVAREALLDDVFYSSDLFYQDQDGESC